MRSLALLDLGLFVISSSRGVIGFFVTFLAIHLVFICHVKSSISSLLNSQNISFVNLSSSEWNVIQAIIQSLSRISIASLRLFLITSNSSFTSILSAWNTLVFDFGSKLDFSIISSNS